MRKADVYVQDTLAGVLQETDDGTYVFIYRAGYSGPPVSLTMPVTTPRYAFATFPPYFEGLLPEGSQLEALLRREKIDTHDYFAQLVTVGADLVGDVTVRKSA
jgi:serine/threonine-protein kinase HipA